MSALAAFAAGLVFGIGLILGGMTDPGKVIGFLDIAGSWDPSLAFVMGGAVLVGFFAFALARRRATAFLGGAMHLPQRRDVDARLVLAAWCSASAGARRVLSRPRARFVRFRRGPRRRSSSPRCSAG